MAPQEAAPPMVGTATERLFRKSVPARLLVTLGLVGFVAAVYGLVVFVGGALLHRPPPSVPLAVVATAVVAVGLEPIRRALRRRLAASPYDQLAAFSTQLADAVATADLTPRMARLLAEGTSAHRVEVWLGRAAGAGPDTLAARWPEGAAAIDPADPQVSRHEVVQGGARLGAILRDTGGAETEPVEQRLLDDLLASTGLALRTVALTADLERRIAESAARAAELRASRARIVTAADAARHRLERDIHDGAQQHLVALAVQLSLVATVARRDPGRARTLLGELGEVAESALATLEGLSHGIYPPVLAGSGIGAAVRAAAVSSPVPVRVSERTTRRFPVEVEATAYFGCLEAVQNAIKHARAGGVDVVLAERDGWLIVEVHDDGIGFDPAAADGSGPGGGSGLGNLRERAETLGAAVRLRSTPGAGTTVGIRIPAGPDGPDDRDE